MVLSGGGNAWTNHVRAFATKNKMTYMCALSNPECSSSYKSNKPVKKRGRPPKKAAQQEEAEFDYGDVFEGTPMTEQSLTPPERSSLAKASKAKARKTADRVGMMAEDVNVGSKGRKQVATVVKAKTAKVAKPSGRPRKYADVEEARKANIQKTNENRKKYVSQRKVPIKPKKLTKAEKIAEENLQRVMTKQGITREQAVEERRKKDEAFRREVDEHLDFLQQPVRRAVPEITLASVTVPKGRGKGKKGGMTPPPPSKKTRCSPPRRVSPIAPLMPMPMPMPIPMPPYAFTPINHPTRPVDYRPPPPIRHPTFGGRKKKGYSIHNFIQDINKANPVMYGIKNHPNVGIKLGQVTNDNLLPAVVAVGKPVYDATAMSAATLLTGNPLLGKVAADAFFNEYGRPYDPRDRQDNEALKVISEKVGQAAGKEAKNIGGATAQQRGIAAQLRGFFNYQDSMKFGKNIKYLYNMLSAIVHSAEYPTDRFGNENKYGLDDKVINIFRDRDSRYDDRAEKFIQKSLDFVRDNPSAFYPPEFYDRLRPKPLSIAAPVFKPSGSGGNISMTTDSDSDDDMSGINWREICDALGGGPCQSSQVVPTMDIDGVEVPISAFPLHLRNPPSFNEFRRNYNATHAGDNPTAIQMHQLYDEEHIEPLRPYVLVYLQNITRPPTPYGSDISSEYNDVNFANTLSAGARDIIDPEQNEEYEMTEYRQSATEQERRWLLDAEKALFSKLFNRFYPDEEVDPHEKLERLETIEGFIMDNVRDSPQKRAFFQKIQENAIINQARAADTRPPRQPRQ